MKFNFSKFAGLLLIAGLMFTAAACGGSSSESSESTETVAPTDAAASTSKYVCPMMCQGSAKEEAGKCSGCGMDLVERSSLKVKSPTQEHEGHDHGDHEGHDHGDHEGHSH